MKIVVNHNKSKDKDKYPKLMIGKEGDASGIILLVINGTKESLEGAIIKKDIDNKYDLLEYDADWVRGCFEDFSGSITLSND